MKNKLFALILLLPLLFQCNKEEDYSAPSFFDQDLDKAIPIGYEDLKHLEGTYASVENNPFGSEFVCLANFKTLTFISNRGGIYFVLKPCFISFDTSIIMSGYWRSPLTSEKGNVRISITNKVDIKKFIDNTVDSSVTFNVIFNTTDDIVIKDFKLKFSQKFSSNISNSNFKVLAHRGGGRNSDGLPYSENSLEMIKHAEDFGASGIEIDIKLTKDKIPVLYHDDDINIRLTKKNPLMGEIEKYNYVILSDYIQLIRGEHIPTLEEAFDAVIDSTLLEVVWLDIKGNPDIFNIIDKYIDAANKKAIQKNRKLKIYAGLPTDEVVKEFKEYKNYTEFPSLCEISLDLTKELNSKVWAPRWTLGEQDALVQDAHNNGIEVFVWTLDEESFIRQYVRKQQFDGILTNYPSLVAYQFYSQK